MAEEGHASADQVALSAKNLNKALEVLSDEELNTLYDLLNKVYKAN